MACLVHAREWKNHKYISKKRGRSGKWIYKYADDVKKGAKDIWVDSGLEDAFDRFGKSVKKKTKQLKKSYKKSDLKKNIDIFMDDSGYGEALDKLLNRDDLGRRSLEREYRKTSRKVKSKVVEIIDKITDTISGRKNKKTFEEIVAEERAKARR